MVYSLLTNVLEIASLSCIFIREFVWHFIVHIEKKGRRTGFEVKYLIEILLVCQTKGCQHVCQFGYPNYEVFGASFNFAVRCGGPVYHLSLFYTETDKNYCFILLFHNPLTIVYWCQHKIE